MPTPSALKQKLPALATNFPNNGESSSGPRSALAGTTSKLRTLFNNNTVRRQYSDQNYGSFSQDKLQEVMSKLIFQAGVDYETRPMVVMNASALPDPKEVSYDQLLDRILSYLNLYVEADYTVVFFAAGGRNTPGWNWVWKAYRSLSRKYRKNLKQLYIVHTNFFTKMLFSLAGTIISPKFFRKITYITTLSELAHHVPLTQIDIPPAVYQENAKHEKEINLPSPQRADLFGVPLEELMGYDGEKGGIPRVVKDCTQYLRQTGMREEGLFRRSPSSALLKQVKQAYDRGHVVSLDTFGDPHLAAVLLKKYLRDLPEPPFPEKLYPVIRRCPIPSTDPTDITSILYIRETLLPELPHCFYILLSHVLHLLHEVSLRSSSNRMDASNLTVVICPNLVKGSNPVRDVMMCSVSATGIPSLQATSGTSVPSSEDNCTLGLIIKLCIERYFEVFDEVADRSEPLPQSTLRDVSTLSTGHQPRNRDSMLDDDEEIDDAMLVMPIGPSASGRSQSSAPPSAWSGAGSPSPATRHRSSRSKDMTSPPKSLHTTTV